ncbi:MAG: protein-(glutamine-N5) methyltransferase, release factor-specific [Proteobacteria bacterium TMED261]|nr:MAG: protein-(glutamine-N5) methyltransferase, release factor-specific [Proteobacteria bacterium TMED261]
MILEQTIQHAYKTLKESNINSYQLDAEIILSNIMGVTREFLITNSNQMVTKDVIQKYLIAIERRKRNEPVAYITGKKEFWSNDFMVNHGTLVPRPETELLIYKLISLYKNKKVNILDIGTGSGCILLSLLSELKEAKGTGIDISSKAIITAISNARKMELLNRSRFKVLNFENFYSTKYDLIVSNPPYIPFKDIKNLSKDIKNFEPIVALNGGNDGLDIIKKIIYKSDCLLKKNGILAIEIGYNQYSKVNKLLKYNRYREVSKEFDYNNNVRCIITTKM